MVYGIFGENKQSGIITASSNNPPYWIKGLEDLKTCKKAFAPGKYKVFSFDLPFSYDQSKEAETFLNAAIGAAYLRDSSLEFAITEIASFIV
jgi:hypothetical protein